MTESIAQTLILVARNARDRGRELEPHMLAELEIIARSDLPSQHEALAILAVERAA